MVISESQEIDEITNLDSEDSLLEGSEEDDLNAGLSRDISLERADRGLSELLRWFDDGDLILHPEWQRNFVWSKKQSSKLIESFLLNIPVPVVYFAKTEEDRYEVIDGLQRLTSVFDFFNNKFSLVGLDVLTDLNGKTFNQLEDANKRKLRNSTLRSFELAKNSESDVHFIVFERLNTGGTKLNEMEIRNCIFRGKLNNLLGDLALDPDFIKCINTESLSKRMNDRALVLRFIAFYERTHHKFSRGLKKFLNEFFETYRDPSDQKLAEYRQVFQKCMKASITVFGNQGFRVKSNRSKESKSVGEWSKTINAAIYQAVATSFAKYDLAQITRAADRIYEAYLDLITTDGKWTDCVRSTTGDPTRVAYVFDTWEKRLAEVMADVPPNDKQRTFSKSLKTEMFNQDKTCSICKQEIRLLDDASLDHEVHYWRGGATVPENARLAHRFCNNSRGGR